MKKIVWANVFLLLGIILIGAFFRFFSIDWDQGNHLHPDERFLTMVGTAMHLPTSFANYLDPATSPFNPANIGHQFYVYGTFPVVANYLLALTTLATSYADFTLQGRIVSGFLDLFIILLVFKTLRIFERAYTFAPAIKYWGAFFYAIAVLPIQLAHFFTVDTFLNFFLFTAFYLALKFAFERGIHTLIFSAIFLGIALSSKITAVFITPLILFLLISFLWQKTKHKTLFTKVEHLALVKQLGIALVILVSYGIITYLTVRLANPYFFANSNFFDLKLNPLLLENWKALAYWGSAQAWYPPGVQWLHKTPFLFSLQNLIVFGLGIPFFFFLMAGMVTIARKYRNPLPLFATMLWALGYFIYQSIQLTQTMRYFLILYPFFAIFAAIGFHAITRHWHIALKGIAVALILLWPMLFLSIYTKPHSRVSATDWMHNTIPAGSIILVEHWDDALPLGGNTPEHTYVLQELPVFDQDTPEKWAKMEMLLASGDYYILSSNRAFGSIPTAPERYPRMTQFYADLFAGKLGYKKIKEFTSYPSLSYLGIPLSLPDQWSEEAFTVYDHPRIIIFQKQ